MRAKPVIVSRRLKIESRKRSYIFNEAGFKTTSLGISKSGVLDTGGALMKGRDGGKLGGLALPKALGG